MISGYHAAKLKYRKDTGAGTQESVTPPSYRHHTYQSDIKLQSRKHRQYGRGRYPDL